MEAPRALAGLRSIAGFAALVVSLLSASTATATAAGRDVVLRFMQPDGQHDLFYRAYVSDIASGIEHVIEAGIASPDGDGVGQIVVELDDASSFRVALTAENEIGESPRSNSIVIAASAPTCDPRDCDDGDPCTTDVCFGDACLSEPAGDGTRCDDGFVDTVDDQCVAGVCEGVLLACRGEADCDDGNVCNGLEVCDGGTVCLEGIPLECGEPTACESR